MRIPPPFPRPSLPTLWFVSAVLAGASSARAAQRHVSAPGESGAGAATASAAPFPGPSYRVHGTPKDLVTGDLNGDGMADVVVAHDLGKASVLLSTGGGRYAPFTTFSRASQGDASLAMGDFDADGDLDVVVGNIAATNLDVHWNDGAGGLHTRKRVKVRSSPRDVAVADLDADGLPDLVTANFNDDSVSVVLNAGGGTFDPQVVHSLGTNPNRVGVSDMDGDGDLDVVAVDGTGEMFLLGNQGGGMFGAPSTLAFAVPCTGFHVGDVNGDGLGDVVMVTSALPSELRIWHGDGNGGVVAWETHPMGYFARDLVVRDWNRDGAPDIAAVTRPLSSPNDSAILLWRNSGSGSFQWVRDVPVIDPGELDLADVDGDSDLDLLLADEYTNSVAVFTNHHGRRFDAAHERTLASQSWDIEALDFEGDGDMDLLVSGSFGDALSLLENLGNGRIEPPMETFLSAAGQMAVGDMTGDGLPDVAAFSGNDIVVFQNMGGTALGNSVTYSPPRPLRNLETGDLDGDGDLDIGVTHSGDGLSVILNDGGGGFSVGLETYATGSGADEIRFGDVDLDGILDAVVANRTGPSFSVLAGRGDASFEPAVTYALGGSAWAEDVVLGDLDGDGDLDVAAQTGYGLVWTWFNAGDGTFLKGVEIPVTNGSLALGDVDADGDLDLLAGGRWGRLVFLLENDGLGGFGAPQPYATGSAPRFLAVADFNGDRRDDLAVAYDYEDEVSVLLSRKLARTLVTDLAPTPIR